ncbi:ferredoxin-type protein NapF [Paraferrimonas haliotis]|uniref:Ferredoxin-type protein NapF n=1 Tax=Paraferrimonas haliotis TaxID=2013866 RepID=A0AA37TM52_9GAMM|nr:ferredoxin-type protein NapF [Paraferrimonas haliotis]GLS83842.1 ferredoxin-type protein NapF [Paraferrimonas haliotis]GLS83969.1 ferredoxin-type protein NapF [Paraferrimonas haliotis]
MSPLPDLSRRRLLSRDQALPVRLPWLQSEQAFIDACTRCGDCIDACPNDLIKKGRGGFVEVSFSNNECTFCKACVEVCTVDMFTDFEQSPWPYYAQISESCLTYSQVVCQSCKDACDPRAITIKPVIGRIATPSIDVNSCTSCGACISVCPSDAIAIQTKLPNSSDGNSQ